MSKINSITLNDISASGRSVISGPFGSSIGKRFFKEEGIPVIRGNNLTTDFKKFKDSGFVFLTEEKADELKADAIRKDILFTAAGTIGQVGMIPESSKYERYVISNKQLRFRVDTNKADPDFVYYWLASPWIHKTIENRNTGSTVPLINLGIIKSLPISLPEDIREQKKISKLLSSIDQKIELNNKINAELEAMAKLIYDYWFVQFDFPDVNGNPYKSSGGKMVYNEELKREIPDGWTVGNVDKECTVRNGYAFKSESYTESGYTIVRTKNFTGGSVELGDMAYISHTEAESFKRYELAKFDFLLVMVGASVGKNVIVNSNVLPALQNQNMWCFRSRHQVQHFSNQLLKRIVKEQLSTSSGSARAFFKKESFKEAKFANPVIELKKLYCEKVEGTFNRIDIIKSENQKLVELRDWLLPMLMNGQVTVKDA